MSDTIQRDSQPANDAVANESTRPLILTILGLIAWTVHLGAIYVVSALLHRHGRGARHGLNGMSTNDTTVLALTVIAAVVPLWGLIESVLHTRRRGTRRDAVDAFGWRLCRLSSTLFLFAIVIEGVVVLWLPS